MFKSRVAEHRGQAVVVLLGDQTQGLMWPLISEWNARFIIVDPVKHLHFESLVKSVLSFRLSDSFSRIYLGRIIRKIRPDLVLCGVHNSEIYFSVASDLQEFRFAFIQNGLIDNRHSSAGFEPDRFSIGTFSNTLIIPWSLGFNWHFGQFKQAVIKPLGSPRASAASCISHRSRQARFLTLISTFRSGQEHNDRNKALAEAASRLPRLARELGLRPRILLKSNQGDRRLFNEERKLFEKHSKLASNEIIPGRDHIVPWLAGQSHSLYLAGDSALLIELASLGFPSVLLRSLAIHKGGKLEAWLEALKGASHFEVLDMDDQVFVGSLGEVLRKWKEGITERKFEVPVSAKLEFESALLSWVRSDVAFDIKD